MSRLPPPHRIRQIAARAGEDGVDERTVLRFLRGEPVRPVSAARIDRALAELGIDAPDHDEAASDDSTTD